MQEHFSILSESAKRSNQAMKKPNTTWLLSYMRRAGVPRPRDFSASVLAGSNTDVKVTYA